MEIYPQDKIALRWGMSLGLASLCFVVGGWGLFVTLRGSALVMRWNHLVFCFVLGVGLLVVGWRFRHPRKRYTAEGLQSIGFGTVCAKQDEPLNKPYTCGACGKSFSTTPYRRDDLLFPTPTCEQLTRSRDAARQRAKLAPPLALEETIALINELTKLAEEVMEQSQNNVIDPRQILLARHQKGIMGRFHQLLTTLYLRELPQWANRLEKAPPPNVNEAGDVEGTQRFFEVARLLKRHLLDVDFPATEPFDILGYKGDISWSDLVVLREQSASRPPAQQQAIARLDLLMQREEARWLGILNARGAYPVAPEKGCPYYTAS